MIPNNAFNVSLLQAAEHSTQVLKVEGYVKTTTGNAVAAWLQVHDTNTNAVAGVVPVKEWPVYDTSEFYKEFKNGELDLGLGCFVGLSSTEGTYTATGAVTMDISVETRAIDFPVGNTYVGDLSTPVDNLTVWADDATGASKRLLSIEVDPDGYGALWLLLYAKVSPLGTEQPIKAFYVPAAGLLGVNKLDFGLYGVANFSQDADGTKHNGCRIILSTAANGLPVVTTFDSFIKAEYVTIS